MSRHGTDKFATASLAALNAELRLQLGSLSGARIDVRGTFDASFVLEASADGTNWVSVSTFDGSNVAAVGPSGQISRVGNYTSADLTGFSVVRVRCSRYVSGTASISVILSEEAHAGSTGYDPVDDMMKVKSVQKKMRDSFTRPLTDLWDVTQSGGSTAAASAGVLTIASGTTAGGFAEILSKDTFTIPFRAMFAVQSGATRQANTHHMIEAVSVDPQTGLPDGRHSMDFDIGGAASTTVTQTVYGVQNGGLRSLRSSASTIVTTATYSLVELEPFSDEAYFHSRTMDATSGRANSYVRHQQIPDPTAVYKLRIRSMNHGAWNDTITNAVAGTGNVIRLTAAAHGRTTGDVLWVEQLNGVTNNGAQVRGNFTVTVIDANTLDLQGTAFGGAYVSGSGRWALAAAPAASISLQCQFVNCQDYAELTAEITAGRGQIVEGQAIATRNVSGSTTAVTGTVTVANQDNLFWNESVTAQAISATVTGTARDTGVAAGAAHRYAAFNAFAFADQAGTLRIEVSTDGTTWRRATADQAVAANAALFLSVPVAARYHRAVYVNGASAQTAFMLNTSYTVA